jgi:hypothetical protein
LSGITAFASGSPIGLTLQNADNIDLVGGGDGTRLVTTGDPTLSGGDRSLERWVATSVFRRAARGEIGNAGKDVIRQPGTHVWDMTIFKNVGLGQRRYLQLRWEAYNVFNHTQFSGSYNGALGDTNLTDNPGGGLIVGTGNGNAYGTRGMATFNPRQVMARAAIRF